jgi:hypothetical protein
MDPLADIAVFVRVVEHGSFTAAAEALELSKAAVPPRWPNWPRPRAMSPSSPPHRVDCCASRRRPTSAA